MPLQSVYVSCREKRHILFREIINMPVFLKNLWNAKNLLSFFGNIFPQLILCVNSWLFVLVLPPLNPIITQFMFHTIPSGRCLWLHCCIVLMNITKRNWRQWKLWFFFLIFFCIFLIYMQKDETRNLALKTDIYHSIC